MLRTREVHLAYDASAGTTPVTLLHGFSQRRSVWDELRGTLARRVAWITIDMRGHGATRVVESDPWTIDACADDVVALWDALGIERSHLAGYSMGGRVALRLAVRHPDRLRTLLVMSAHAGLDDAERVRRRQADEELARMIERSGAAWFAGYWGNLELFASLRRRRPDLAVALEEMRAANDPAGLAASLRGVGAGAMLPMWESLPRVDCPAAVLAGAEDARYVSFAHRLGGALHRARVTVVADSGHAVFLEQPGATARMLGALLDSAEPR